MFTRDNLYANAILIPSTGWSSGSLNPKVQLSISITNLILIPVCMLSRFNYKKNTSDNRTYETCNGLSAEISYSHIQW